MTIQDLARSYFRKASDRREILDVLFRKEAWSDVVREAQEIVELALKGMLRIKGLEPPKFHDVGPFLLQFQDRFAEHLPAELEDAAAISLRLRKDREIAFYGDVDLIPTEIYGEQEASQAIEDTDRILNLMHKHM